MKGMLLSAIGLAKAIEKELGFKASAPALDETRHISSTEKDYPIKKDTSFGELAKPNSAPDNLDGISDQ